MTTHASATSASAFGGGDERTARYYDLSTSKSETPLKNKNGMPLLESEYKDFYTTPNARVPPEWDCEFGDVLNWSKGRPTEAFFVLEDGALLKNPDRSGSGYLTIPYIFTKNSRNALLKYEYVINGIGKDYVTSVEMHPEDVFIKKNWGDVPQEMITRKVEFIYDPLEEFLYVNIPHTTRSKEFRKGDTTMKDINTWYHGAIDDLASFRVKYNFTGPDYQKYHDLYRLHNEKLTLPKTWSFEPGTTDLGHDYKRGEWICHGDRKHMSDAKKVVQDFYRDLTVSIEEDS